MRSDILQATPHQLISEYYSIWPGQRGVNFEWIETMYNEQVKYYQHTGCFIFPGSIIVVTYNNKNYIVDGQHRHEVMVKLTKAGYDLSGLQLAVQVYNCENAQSISEIFKFSNNRYTTNAPLEQALNAGLGQPVQSLSNYKAKEVAQRVQIAFRAQAGQHGCIAPKFDVGLLESELLARETEKGILTKYTVDEIYGKILALNDKVRMALQNNPQIVTECQAGFYLPYHRNPGCRGSSKYAARCRWVQLLE